MSLVHLHSEILAKIASLLTSDHAFRMASSCYNLRLTVDHPVVWKKIVVSVLNEHVLDDVDRSFESNCKSWKGWAYALAFAERLEDKTMPLEKNLMWLPHLMLLRCRLHTSLSD